MTRDIVLVHEDPNFIETFQEKLNKNGTRVTLVQAGEDLLQKSNYSESVVVINTENNWEKAIAALESLKKKETPFYAIISESTLLQRTLGQIDSTSEQLALNGAPAPRNRRKTDREAAESNFSELLEKRLADFVKKISASEGKNLYDLLIQEVEKPLIKLVLDETKGNQVQASQLLGMHRNTLRKKMKELQISFPKKISKS